MLFVPGVFANSALWKIQICTTAIYVFLVLQIKYVVFMEAYILHPPYNLGDIRYGKICFCQRHALLECLDSCLLTIFSDYYWCRFLQIWYILVKIASRRNVKKKKDLYYLYIIAVLFLKKLSRKSIISDFPYNTSIWHTLNP